MTDPSTFTIDEIQNSDAGPDSQNRYEICSRTGFKQRAGDIVEDGYQQLVRPDSADEMHPQDKNRYSARGTIKGATIPEPPDVFIDDSVWALADGTGYVLAAEGGAIAI